jgi:hypothetical protein
MRWITRTIALFAILSLSTVAAWSQAKECTEEFKTATYSKWYDNRIEHQDVAYEAATEYLTVCPQDESPYATALRNFKKKYEDLKGIQNVAAQFQAAVEKNNYADTMRLGRQIVSGNPDNALVYIYMANTGLNDPNLLGESGQAAKKAIELIEAGKPFAPTYKNSKDLALASLTYVIAKATAKTAPVDAIPYFIKAAKYESDIKKNALLYNELAAAHGERVAKLTTDYEPYIGKPETPESKLILANLNQALDLQIDALARATALADAANKPALKERLTELYKFRNKSEAGLDGMLAGVLAKPIPDVPAPITQLPTPAPAATPTPTPASPAPGNPTTGGAAPGASPKTSGATSSSAGKTNTSGTSTPPATTAKPTATPKPKPKKHHRRQ